ncbi:kinase-like domain-containing protein [Lentinula edodes]|uniref:Kinase-like domain-containing protein n=1 Tax=Lentinula lateritia TaxID=40482 RepID=A0A9W9AXY4_9AGAR|nr:kinase-like domain-containing protein [Lentinula edodes]
MRDTSFLRESEQLDARRFLISLSKISTNLPQYMFIDGVASVKDKNSYGGTFGDVYRSTYKGKPVALKRLRHFQLEESHRIYQEALIWQRLYHKFILPFLGIDAENFPRQPCMVSPWMANGTITQFLKHNPKANIDKLCGLTTYMVGIGIHYLHSQNIVHGDIKGGNILIDESGQPRLADFGLTVFADGTRHNTTDQGGTLRWMAPELLYPIPGIECYKRTTASDVYAYGCLCIEVYTGRVPFADVRSEIMVLEKVLKGERPERPLGTNAMTDELWNLINACWKHDRAARPKSGLVVDHLKHILRRSATDPAVLPFVDPLPPPTAYSYTSPQTARYFTPFSQTLTMYGAPTRTRPLEEQAAVLRSLKRIRRHADPGRMYHELKLTYVNLVSLRQPLDHFDPGLLTRQAALHSRIMLLE